LNIAKSRDIFKYQAAFPVICCLPKSEKISEVLAVITTAGGAN